MITPNCSWLMPIWAMIGRKMGATIRMTAVPSRNMPSTSRMKMIIKMSAVGFAVMESMPSMTWFGTRWWVMK